jgi:multiple sugar transport system substrate-binding protein
VQQLSLQFHQSNPLDIEPKEVLMIENGMSRRSFLRGMVGSSVLLTLAACTAPLPGGSPGGEQAGAAQEGISIRWHHRLGDYQSYPLRIAAFEEANPGVTVVQEEFPAGSAEYGPKVASLIAAGTVGDVAWTALGSGSYQFLMQNNGLAPIDDFVEADDSDFSLDGYYPRIIQSLRFEEKLFGLPELAHGVQTCLFYNQDMLEAAGLELPTMEWTRDKLLEVARPATNGDIYGFLPATGDYSNLRNHTLTHGAEIMSEDGTTSLLEDDGVKEALRWVHALFTEHQVAPTPQQMQGTGRSTEQMFVGEQIAMFQSGGWNMSIGTLVEDAFTWGVVLMPKGPADHRGGHLHVDAEAVTNLSQQKQLAYEFIKYLTDHEGAVQVALQFGLAARPGVYEDERIASNPNLVLLGQATEESAEHINPANLRKQELQTTIKAIFDPIWLGDAAPDDAFFADASGQFQEFLDKAAG